MERYAKMTTRPAQNPMKDWVRRLRDMADEAGDNELLALESDILDLRNEIQTVLSSKNG